MPNSNVAVGTATVGPKPTYYSPANTALTGDAYAVFDFTGLETNTIAWIIERSDDVTKEFCSVGLLHPLGDASRDYNVAWFEADALPAAAAPTVIQLMNTVIGCAAAPYNVNSVPADSTETPVWRAKGKFLYGFITATTDHPGCDVTAKLYEWNDRDGRYKD